MAVGQFVNPAPMNRPAPGAPPANVQDAGQLQSEWKNYLSQPAVAASLFQFGASMLANVGGGGNFVQRLGTSLGDAGQAGGRAQKFVTETDQANRQLSQGDQRIGLEGQRVKQDAANAERQGRYQDSSLALQNKQLDATTANNQAELSLRGKELLSNSSYRAAALQLQREQTAASKAGILSPRGRALNEVLKAAMTH